jgi:uncharacterized membrane protein (DUF485 family)
MEKTKSGFDVNAVLQSSQFKKLVARRWIVSICLTILILSVYFGFILSIAFKKEMLAYKIGAHVPLALPIGLAIIIFAWALTGIYVYWANNHYDNHVIQIKKTLE